MIDLPLLLPFVGASVMLMLIPGPNVALIVATSVGAGDAARTADRDRRWRLSWSR